MSGEHVGFIIGAYALSALLLAGLVIYVLVRDRNLRAEVLRLEQSHRHE